MIRLLLNTPKLLPSCVRGRMFGSDLGMFCFQCEQTRGGKFCTVPKGVCQKTPNVAALQDLLIEIGKRVATYSTLGAKMGYVNPTVDEWLLDAYFSTLTNVNFDPQRFEIFMQRGADALKEAREGYLSACKKANVTPETIANCNWQFRPGIEALAQEGRVYGIDKKKGDWNAVCVKELAQYGLKGGIAYLHHAMRLGYKDPKINAETARLLSDLRKDMNLDEALKSAMDVGEWNYKVIELLDKANTESYGKQEISVVRTTPVKGKCILVSGHDLRDLDEVLRQTEGRNINVYTHGEMLPCNAYPKLKKYKHLIGNYGGPWQRQKKDFEKFPGSILMTTNCLIPPSPSYAYRLFTHNSVGCPGSPHIAGEDMLPLIQAAEKEEGFLQDSPKKEITIGFARDTVLGLAPELIEGLKSKAIKHIFIIGGCDGFELGRNYYTDFAKQVPDDCLMLTMACGKYRFNMLDLGYVEIKGKRYPRVFDMGQCNDAYSGIQIAIALSKELQTPINELPLSFVLSWFEQKAVAILLTFLSFGVKNMLLGPSLPAFTPPDVLNVLSKKLGLRHISTPEADMQFLLNRNK